MRLFFITGILFLTTYSLIAQSLVSIATGLSTPNTIASKGNLLYMAENNTLSSITLDDPNNLNYTSGIANMDAIQEMCIVGDSLYCIHSFGAKISRIDLAATNPTPVEIATGLNFAEGIAVKGDNLYWSSELDGNIYKIDLSSSSFNQTTLIYTNKPNHLAIHGDDLYIAENGAVTKMSLSNPAATTDVITGLNVILELVIHGDDLYIADGFILKKADLSASSITASVVIQGLGFPRGLAFYNDDLYIAEANANKISKLVPPMLSTSQLRTEAPIKIDPVPTTDFIQISGLKQVQKYQIYNTTGILIRSGIIANNDRINVENLDKGLYLLKIDNKQTTPFIKA